MQIIRLSIILSLLAMGAAASAQNLIEDGHRLLNELDILKDTALVDNHHSAVLNILSVLSAYDDPFHNDSPDSRQQLEHLLQNVQANPLLRGLLPTDYLRLARPTATIGANTHQEDIRKRIGTLMYGGAPVSPLQYLSVEQSLQNSRLPTLQNQEAMRAMAGNAQAAKPVSALQAEALMEGLFQFVLERAQQEVAVSFIENLLNKNKKALHIDSLFPNVAERYFNSEVNYSQSFLEGLREAFFLDLKNLSRTLPDLLFKDKYFAVLRDDPVFYSVLATYALFGQSNQGRPIWESVPLVHREIYARRQAADKNLNVQLADSAIFESDEYIHLQGATQAYVEQLRRVADAILDFTDEYVSRKLRLQSKGVRTASLPVPPSFDYRLLTSRDSTPSLHLGLLPELLQGRLDDHTLRSYNTLEWNDLFSTISSQEMRIAGLELTRRVVDGSWYNGLSQVDILRRWQADLAAYQLEFDLWEMKADTNKLNQRLAIIADRRTALSKIIAETRQYWTSQGASADTRLLIQLEAIAGKESGTAGNPLLELQQSEEELNNLEKRVVLLEERLAKKKTSTLFDSPFQQYLRNKKPDGSLEKLAVEIDSLEALSNVLLDTLKQLYSLKASKEHRVLKNTVPMLQATELLSNLFYVLQDSDGKGLITPDTFETMLFDPRLRTACLGLMHQRFSRIRDLGQLSPDALAELAELTLNDFAALPGATGNPLAGKEPEAIQPSDSVPLFQSVTIGLRALNRVLEFPFFIDPNNPQKLVSLKGKSPELQYVPEISGHCIDLLYYLEVGQHRSAVSALVRMLSAFSKQRALQGAQGQSPPKEEAALVRFLATYGDFIAGLADARNKEEVQYLMHSLADDPGSSRTKRTHALSASFNAYLGVSFGTDRWAYSKADTTLRSEYWALAPSIPIGFTFSWLVFKNKKQPQSFSLHLIGADLGGMLTYRLEDQDKFGAYKLSVKNIVKPGAQVQWNIQKTPCYVALGWQTGAQVREENGEEIALRSRRVFLSVGLDAPIRTLFAK